MSDARIVEVIALEIAPWMKHTIGAVNAAQGVLAALRAEGFEWYRPNECETEPVMDTDSIPAVETPKENE